MLSPNESPAPPPIDAPPRLSRGADTQRSDADAAQLSALFRSVKEPAQQPSSAPTLTVAELRSWLQTERCGDGTPLESRLEGGSLDALIDRYADTYADGAWGFPMDRAALQFAIQPTELPALRDEIESGRLNSVVIVAFPRLEEAARVIHNPARMNAVEFLARHFVERGGSVVQAHRGLEHWRALRFPTAGGSLATRFQEAAEVHRFTEFDYGAIQREVYDHLGPPPTLGQLAGTVTGRFVLGRRELLPGTDGDRGVGLLRAMLPEAMRRKNDGRPLNLAHAVREGRSLISPLEFLALNAASAVPSDAATYLNHLTSGRKYWELIGGITESHVAVVDAVGSGLRLLLDHPQTQEGALRVRAVSG